MTNGDLQIDGYAPLQTLPPAALPGLANYGASKRSVNPGYGYVHSSQASADCRGLHTSASKAGERNAHKRQRHDAPETEHIENGLMRLRLCEEKLPQQCTGLGDSDRTASNWREDDIPAWFHIFDTDADGDNVLFLAIIHKQTSLVLPLINLVQDYNKLSLTNRLSQTALHLAALTDNASVARRLIVAGIRVDIQDHNGNTALHIACIRGNEDVTKALLTPVTYAETVQNSYQIPFQPLPQNLEIRNYEGQNCLILAALHKHSRIIDLLLARGADINSREMKAGRTSLHIAAGAGDLRTVEHICSKHSVNLEAKTYSGYTPTELAFYKGYYNTVYALRTRGASQPRDISLVEDSD